MGHTYYEHLKGTACSSPSLETSPIARGLDTLILETFPKSNLLNARKTKFSYYAHFFLCIGWKTKTKNKQSKQKIKQTNKQTRITTRKKKKRENGALSSKKISLLFPFYDEQSETKLGLREGKNMFVNFFKPVGQLRPV